MKLCKDCKWGQPSKIMFFIPCWDGYSRCANPDVNKTKAEFYVSGDAITFCDLARASNGNCAPEGTHWEAK